MKSKKGISASEPVYEFIKEMILSCQIKSGEKIQEQKIAEQLGVSRTPMREAITRLANDGLVRIYPNRYSEVVTFSEDDIRQIGEMRIELEMMSAKMALYHGSNADFDKMQRLAEECSIAAKSGDKRKMTKADAKFHLAFTECTKNKLLHKFQSELSLRIELIQMNSMFTQEESLRLSEYHEQIVKLLKERNTEEINRIIVEHFYKFYNFESLYPKNLFYNIFSYTI